MLIRSSRAKYGANTLTSYPPPALKVPNFQNKITRAGISIFRKVKGGFF